MPNYRVGCAGWAYAEWSGPVYADRTPPGRRLEMYASLFPTVEADTTFYALPEEAVVRSWLRQVEGRPGFSFVVKLSREVTHDALPAGRPANALETVEAFVERLVRPLESANRLEAILVQLPPSFALPPTGHPPGPREWLVRVLEALDPKRRHVGVELRHPSWFGPDPRRLEARTFEALAGLNVACVQGDKDGTRFTDSRTADWSFFRLHGPSPRGEPKRHGAAPHVLHPSLAETAPMIQAWARVDERVVVILTHHDEGQSARNAADLMERLGLPKPRLPATPPGLARLDSF